MSKEEIRKRFTEVMAQVERPEDRAKLELLREYFTNEEFRQGLADWSFERTYKVGR